MKAEAINRTEKGPETRCGPAAHRGTATRGLPAASAADSGPAPRPCPIRPSRAPQAATPPPARRPGPALPSGPSPHRPGLPRQAQASIQPPEPRRPAPSRASPADAAGAVRVRPRGPAHGLTCGGGGRARAAGGDRSAAHNEPLQRHSPAPAPPADTHWLSRARAPRAIGSFARPSRAGRGRSLPRAGGRGAGPGLEGPGSGTRAVSPVRLGALGGPVRPGRGSGWALGGETRAVPCAREPGSCGRCSTVALGPRLRAALPVAEPEGQCQPEPGIWNIPGHNPREC